MNQYKWYIQSKGKLIPAPKTLMNKNLTSVQQPILASVNNVQHNESEVHFLTS